MLHHYNNQSGEYLSSEAGKDLDKYLSPEDLKQGKKVHYFPANSTLAELPGYNVANSIIRFNGESWDIVDKQISGQFFRKKDGLLFEIIDVKNIDAYTLIMPLPDAPLDEQVFSQEAGAWQALYMQSEYYLRENGTLHNKIKKDEAARYTTIEPLQKYDDGTTQAFNDTNQTWEYVFKGDDLLEAERIKALDESKQNKIAQLETDYNATKKITLKNGTTWVIEGATYKALKDKLALIFSDNANLTKVYTFFEGDTSKPNYYVNVICYIWRYILKDFYESVLGVGNNRKIYAFTKSDIINAQDSSALNTISWSFTPAVVIEVSEEATKLEQQADTPQYVLDVIATAKDEQGEIHLVKI